MNILLVKNDQAAAFYRQYISCAPVNDFCGYCRFSRNLARYVPVRAFEVAARNGYQAAVFFGCVGDRDPHGYLIGIVGFRQYRYCILMPSGIANTRTRYIAAAEFCQWRLDANLLNRAGRNLGSDQRLDYIQRSRVVQQAEHRRPRMRR